MAALVDVPVALNPAQLRAVRADLGLSQREFAEVIKKAGAAIGEVNGCTKRLVQKWETGEHRMVRAHYRRALEHVTGLPFSALCDRRPVAYATFARRIDRTIRELVQLRADLAEMD